MSYFDFGKWKDKNVAMHCATEEEANDFCRVMHEAGMKWCNGESYKDHSEYNEYKENSVYYFNFGGYGFIDYAIEDSYTILEWSDYMKKEFTKQDLKNGDVCVLKNESILIAIPESGALLGKCGSWGGLHYYSDNLKHVSASMLDIVEVYRPNEPWQCNWEQSAFTKGTRLFDLNKEKPIEITIEEIAELKGVSADRIKIVKNKNK